MMLILAQNLIEKHYDLLPVSTTGKPKRSFINPLTKKYGYPASEFQENDWIGVILDNIILIDVDANKENCTTPATDLLIKIQETLVLDEFLLSASEVQYNDERTSLHYLFTLPDGMTVNDLSRSSNYSKLIKHVDFKTGKGLLYVKPHKHQSIPDKSSLLPLTESQVATIFGLRKDHKEPARCDPIYTDVTTPYGQASLRHINTDATAFTEKGQRNSSLARAVVSTYELVAGGEISEYDAEASIADIVTELDISDEPDTLTTIEANKQKGLRQPRSAPTPVQPHFMTAEDKADYIVGAIKSTYRNQLDLELDIDREAVLDIYRKTYWDDSHSKFMIVDKERIKPLNTAHFIKSAQDNFSPLYKANVLNEHLDAYTDADGNALTRVDKKYWKAYALDRVVYHVINTSGRPEVTTEVDPFLNTPHIEYKPTSATFCIPHEPLSLVGDKSINPKYVEMYEKLFPECYAVMDFVVSSRFADSRKNAYLWIHAPSNWGKTLMIRSLQHIGVETSVSEITQAIKGQNIAKTAYSFAKNFALIIDEFKGITSAIKQLEDRFTVSAKYALATDVPLYAKIFLSAEDVPSLEGDYGVESQFANRFCKIKGDGCINDFKFSSTELLAFSTTVKNLWATEINKRVLNLVKLGKLKAIEKAQNDLDRFTNKYSIRNTSKTLDQSIDSLADDVLEYLLDAYDRGDKKIATWADAPKGHVILKRPADAIRKVLEVYFSKSQRSQLSYKVKDIIKQLGGFKIHKDSMRKSVSGIRIDPLKRTVINSPDLKLLDK